MVRSRLLGLIGSIVGLTFVFDISNIPRVSITDRVGDDLGTAIGKSHAVLSRGSITITVLILSKVGARVVISDSITILVDSRAIINRLRVSGLVGRCWVNNSGFVDYGSRLVDRGRGRFVDWGRFVSGSWVVDRGRFVNGSWVVDGSMVDGSMVDGSMMDGGMMDGVSKSMVDGVGSMREGMVGNGFVGMEGNGGMVGSNILLLVVVLVDLIGGGSRLAVDSCAIATMGFVNGGSYRRGIAVFDELVAVLISGSQSQKRQDSDESLRKLDFCEKLEFRNCISIKEFEGMVL